MFPKKRNWVDNKYGQKDFLERSSERQHGKELKMPKKIDLFLVTIAYSQLDRGSVGEETQTF